MSIALTHNSVCAICLVQDPSKGHVDCDAGTDRGWYGEGTSIPIEWIVVCEDCGKAIGKCLDMVDRDEREREVKALEVKADALERRVKQAEGYADRLEDAFEHRAQPIELDHRRKPRKVKEPVHG